MKEKVMLAAKAGIAATVSAASAAIGWKGVMGIVWVIAMALDYLSGTAAAFRTGEWNSTTAREGLWHKGGMILVVGVAGIADIVLDIVCTNIPKAGISWPGAVLPLVLAWYIITELGSVLENAVKVGANVPTWLVKLLKASAAAVQSAGEEAAEATEKAEN